MCSKVQDLQSRQVAPNFKFIAQIVSEMWTVQYFGDHLKLKVALPRVQNKPNLSLEHQICLWNMRNLCAKFQVCSSNSLQDMDSSIF